VIEKRNNCLKGRNARVGRRPLETLPFESCHGTLHDPVRRPTAEETEGTAVQEAPRLVACRRGRAMVWSGRRGPENEGDPGSMAAFGE